MKIVYIRSRRSAFGRDGNPALKCNPDGHIQANTFGKGLGWEQWKLHPNVDNNDSSLVALESWTGKFLSAKEDGEVRADADVIASWEKFRIVARGDMFVALQSHHGNYLVCDEDHFSVGNSVRANREHINEWEEWAIVDSPDALTSPGHTASCVTFAAGAVVTLGALAVPFLGFGVGGVAAGSVAAAVQSAVYGPATAGVFSVLQSAGATLAWAPVAAGGAAVMGSGGVGMLKR